MDQAKNKLPVSNILIILQAVIILSFLGKCNVDKISIEEQQLKIDQYLSGTQKFEKKINKLNQELATQKVVLINKDKKLEKQLLINSELSKLKSQIKIVTETTYSDLLVEYRDTIRDTIVRFGTPFSFKDKWLTIDGSVEKQGIKLDSLNIYNSYQITVGTKRESIFKKPQTYVELFNENPYTKTNSLNNITVIENKKWYDKTIFKFGAGLIVGGVATYIISR